MRVWAGLALGALVLAACSGGNDDSASDAFAEVRDDADDGATQPSEGAADEDGDEGATDSAEAAPAGDGAAGAVPVVPAQVDLGRDIIYTATVELRVDDVGEATRAAQQAIAGLGGVLFGQDATTDPIPRATLTFKVPPQSFAEALTRLEGVGEVVAQQVTADDVTERVVDLESRITTAEVSVARLRDLLAGATDLQAVAALEGQLLERETTLEQLRGQLRTIRDQVDLATIVVVLSEAFPEPALDVTVTAAAETTTGDRCPGDTSLTVSEGDELVVCVTVLNSGTVALTELTVRDPGMGLGADDFTLVDPDAPEVIEPGDAVVLWAAATAAVDERPNPQVSAVPADEGAARIAAPVAVETTWLELEVLADDSLPGFLDAVGAGWGALTTVVAVAIVVLGAALPFLVLAAVPVGIWAWRRRGAGDRDEAPAPPPPPPPPPSVAPPAPVA